MSGIFGSSDLRLYDDEEDGDDDDGSCSNDSMNDSGMVGTQLIKTKDQTDNSGI